MQFQKCVYRSFIYNHKSVCSLQTKEVTLLPHSKIMLDDEVSFTVQKPLILALMFSVPFAALQAVVLLFIERFLSHDITVLVIAIPAYNSLFLSRH